MFKLFRLLTNFLYRRDMAGQNRIIRFNPIRGGLNTTADDELRPPDQCGSMKNWTRMRTGGFATRNGYQAVAFQQEGGTDQLGAGAVPYTYTIDGVTTEEIVLLNLDHPARVKTQTLTINETLGSSAKVSISPILAGSSPFQGYKLELKDNNDIDQLSLFNGSSKDIDLTDAHENGVVETVADDAAWSLHFQIKMTALPGAGTLDSVVGNQGAASNFERVDIDENGNVVIFDKSNNSTSWSTGFSAGTTYKCTIICDGTNSNNLELYVDSVSQGTATLADSEITIKFIGQKGDNSQYFNGVIEWVALYDYEISTSVIATLEEQTDFPTSPSAPLYFNAVRFYYFNRRVDTSTGSVNPTGAKTMTNLKARIDNEPSFSATIEAGTPHAEMIPMVVNLAFSTSVDITYYTVEEINTCFQNLGP